MNATFEQNKNARELNLLHGKVITSKELNELLKKLDINYTVFIDNETHDEFKLKTGFRFNHNYDDCKTYTLSDFR
jgi:hypothetical protein